MANNLNTFHIITYGCQMNKNDSEKIAALLEHCGLSEVVSEKDADLIILNTCSIRAKSELRVFGKLGQLKHQKKTKPNLKIGICGCMPQYKEKELLSKAPIINLIFGTNTIHRLPELLSTITSRNVIKDIAKNIEQTEIPIPPKRGSLHQAWIPISFGCNNYCTYCIVPHTRGKEKSRKKEDIIKEIIAIDKNKYSKIVLLGQNVNSYGQDMYENYDFADLLQDVSEVPGIKLIDFMTNHPKDISEKLIEVVKHTPNINKSFHLPLQSGDNEILRKMNRHYTVESYMALINKIKKEIPNVEISSDIIVGFPGETEEQFQNSLIAVREIRGFRVNTSAYSPRELTPAATMPDQISTKEKARRLQLLMRIVDESSKSTI
ncbi:MAG: tRNA (N6-isopentenyl adenosine(37)-C2)-methylthiotransferase MiaB [Candidatus Margulisiibacteriota bacterium]|nr:MAG: tRNA (N6-isopentenyl adenosine(37)-C2)-methylthiotransferase MiaB [Candidatus Margulisbacteria bacterium GWD2_39_127]OGI03777.1 MAG: tRNA (N6-isopentenyl adenosine(37)-C2)-methylthiotransferase MiaB [Candidatus Margulisbacteria bacterium GWF2_38_17]OGI05833.1 MAG: tRNA (N6-isopentenyl adenosine(37)-C2)-methylthiotransferase MiaB [Candidatus Margulisbacteria bacterium GWE2_39_32]PZM82329.1 MAG: tRNA (N6-isopentenyl adenosine(37)-C2)-methylthiotransferase MiaB [Candidatus Margulisiibacteri